MQMQRVVDVQAGQNREHISLQAGDQYFQACQRDDKGQRQYAKDAKRPDKPGDHLQ